MTLPDPQIREGCQPALLLQTEERVRRHLIITLQMGRLEHALAVPIEVIERQLLQGRARGVKRPRLRARETLVESALLRLSRLARKLPHPRKLPATAPEVVVVPGTSLLELKPCRTHHVLQAERANDLLTESLPVTMLPNAN